MGEPPAAIALTVVFAALVGAAVAADVVRLKIPNRLTYPAALLGLVTALVFPGRTWTVTLLGGAAMLLIFLPPALAGSGWLGMGDVKLALGLGLFLGFPAAVVAAVAAAVLGGVAAVVLMLRGRDRRAGLPYAPWLAAGSLIALLGMPALAAAPAGLAGPG
jgi:leader peptidase (prepilin peptidase)/N-methyltransferase